MCNNGNDNYYMNVENLVKTQICLKINLGRSILLNTKHLQNKIFWILWHKAYMKQTGCCYQSY